MRTIALLAALGSSFSLAGASCTGDDPLTSSSRPDAAGGDEAAASANPAAAADAGSADGAADAAAPCEALPFIDDFEGRADLKGCWDELSVSGALAATSKAELATLPGTTNHAMHVALVPPYGGASDGALFLSKKLSTPVPFPARLGFKWQVETFPSGGDGSNGFYSVSLTYQYKDAGSFRQTGKVTFTLGVNTKQLNAYLRGGSYQPTDAIEPHMLVESAIEVTTKTATLRTNLASTTERNVTLPDGTDFEVTTVELGVTEVGSISSAWSVYFDDVRLEQK